jgi:glycosyltransferase involved in cell wall biosynthesis
MPVLPERVLPLSPFDRRLRVGLHVGQLLQRNPGGIGRVTQMLCQELPQHATLTAFSSSPRRVSGALRAQLNGVQFHSVGRGSPRWRYALWHRYRGLRIDMPVDVCHAPSLAVPPSAAPLVVTINDVAFLRHPAAFTPHGVRFHEKGLAIARREAAVIIVPSTFTRDELVLEGFDPARIHCVPLGVPALDRSLTGYEAHQRWRRDGGGPYLLVVGTVEPRKAHASIVAAFERLRTRRPDLSLVIAGASGWLPDRMARDLERPGVVVLGHVPDRELDLLYRRAEIVVNASIYEGFGLTVLEALGHGCPVIASSIPAHVELVGDAARLFPPGDIDALVAAIDELLDDPATLGRLRVAARARAERYTIAHSVSRHLAAYEAAARGTPRA